LYFVFSFFRAFVLNKWILYWLLHKAKVSLIY
jgi:hypothetical protein